MKRVKLFSLALVIMLSFGFIGCGNDTTPPVTNIKPDHERIYDEFVEVANVSYMYNNSNTTIYSRFVFLYETITTISSNEFNNADVSKRFNTLSFDNRNKINITRDKSNVPQNLSIDDVVYLSSDSGVYYKLIYTGFEIQYASVRIIENWGIEIKHLGNITTIASNEYKIEYFSPIH